LSNIFVADLQKLFTSSRAMCFLRAQNFPSLTVSRDQSSPHSGRYPFQNPRCSRRSRLDVAILLAQFLLGVFFNVTRFRGETHNKELTILPMA